MRVHLGGHLAFYQREKQSWFEHRLDSATRLKLVLEQLGVPAGEIMLVVVNDEVVDLQNTVVNDRDTVQLYPPNDGG